MTITYRPRVSWRSWLWIVWRQHRIVLTATSALAVGAALYVWLTPADVSLEAGWNANSLWWKPHAPSIMAAVIAGFWAAPLVSREYDYGTHVVSWSWDATPRQWLTSKLVVLAVPAVVLTVLLDVAVLTMFNSVATDRFTSVNFESNVLLAVAYTLFGMALGVTFSALFRQSVIAVGSTLIVFIALRMTFATSIRPYLIPPEHHTVSWNSTEPMLQAQEPPGALRVDSGYTDASGTPVSVTDQEFYGCFYGHYFSQARAECLQDRGVGGHYVDFQPVSRMPALQALEIAIYLVLTAGLLWFALRRVSQRQRL